MAHPTARRIMAVAIAISGHLNKAPLSADAGLVGRSATGVELEVSNCPAGPLKASTGQRNRYPTVCTVAM